MTLRRTFTLYLLAVHLAFAAAMTYLLWEERVWLLAVEACFLLSFLAATRLFRGLFRPLELISSGVEFMREGDFTTRIREIGQPEMDALIGVYNQMTDRLLDERVRLQEQHFFLDKILQVTPSAIVTLDYDGRISYVNPAAEALLESSPTGLAGARLADLHLPLGAALAALATGESAVVAFRGVRKVKCHKSQFLDRGHPRTFYLVEELTEELRRTEKAAHEKLIRMLSHEVNNSLGAANSLLHSCLHYKAQLRAEDRGDFETALTVAIARTEHLNAFMKSFADIVKLPLPRRQPTEIRPLLEHLAALLQADLHARRIRIAWDVQAELPPILADAHQMEQVFLNILKNAMEAIGSDGTITLRTGTANRKAFVSIEDSGGGISAEAAGHLFTPFFSTKEHGQGIGLTLVQEILLQHKFEFTLESAPGAPTQFTIAFPHA